jgi:general secretion pathway protein M
MLKKWQQQLSLRDQKMLALAAGVLVLFALYQIALRPIAAANARLAAQNAAAQNSLAEVTQMAAQLRQLQQTQAQQNGGGENLTQLVDRTVAANQLHMSRFQPGSSGDVQVRLDNVSFDQTLRWLNDLESAQNVAVRELVVAPGAASGLVNVSVRLLRP